MPDKFDRYREALVVETSTVWPPAYKDLDDAERARIEAALHTDAKACEHLNYIRGHTGFCRQITVTDGDLQRLRQAAPAG